MTGRRWILRERPRRGRRDELVGGVNQAIRGGRGFVDASPHRAELPSPYNSYLRVDSDQSYDPAHEAEMMLFRPLFFTSFVNDDFLADSDFFGAGTIVLSSASSKTAIGGSVSLNYLDVSATAREKRGGEWNPKVNERLTEPGGACVAARHICSRC